MRKASFITALFMSLGISCLGRTITVALDGSGEFSTIQAAVDAATTGDVIMLADGVYTGSGNWRATVNKSVTIKSAGGRDVCGIQGTEDFYSIAGLIVQAPSGRVAIEGLTIRNGWRGVWCSEGDCTISDCIIEDNEFRGGISCDSGEVTIRNCTIRNNGRDNVGGIYSSSANLRVADCVIEGNHAGSGGGICAEKGADISRCIIRGNHAGQGGGIQCSGASTIDNVLVVDNTADNAGGIGCSNGQLILINSVVANNTANSGGAGISLNQSVMHMRNSIIRDNQSPAERQIYFTGVCWLDADHCIMPIGLPGLHPTMGQVRMGAGVQDVDPGFVDAAGGDYRLAADSPCVDAGSNDFAGKPLTQDLAGQVRILDGNADGQAIADIGACELLPAGEKVIRASAERLYFTQVAGVLDKAVQPVRIRAEGGDLAFAITEDCPWLTVDTAEGTADADGVEVNLSADTTGLAPGAYACEVAISAAGALNASATVSVILYVVPEEGYWVPFHYPTIQAALDACPDGGTVTVADGVYTKAVALPQRAIVLKSASGPDHCVIIPGLGTGQGITIGDAPDGARLDGFTVSGSLYAVPIQITGGCPTVANCRITRNCNLSPSGTVVCTNSEAVFEGCTVDYNVSGGIHVTNGHVSVNNCTFGNNAAMGGSGFVEGAIYAADSAVIEVSGCTISDNLCTGISGRGDGTITVSDCVITGNAGGGVYTTDTLATHPKGMRLELNGCQVTDNSASQGGGVYCISEGVTEINNCTISRNSTVNTDAGGGGIYAAHGRTLSISDSVIAENTTEGFGGGIWCERGSTLLVDHCVVSRNRASSELWASGWYGGIYAYQCAAAHITRSVLSENTSKFSAGAVRFAGNSEARDFVLDNCIISGNIAESGNAGGVSGVCELHNCTIVGNRSTKAGSAAYLTGRILNCSVRDNVCLEDPQASLCTTQDELAQLRIEYTNFPGGVPEEALYGEHISGANNMDLEPRFVQPGHWDDNGTPDDVSDDTWVEGDYHLLADSPCIDAGDPAGDYAGQVDMDGQPRVLRGRVDMGADEVPYAGDFEPDDDVDLAEFGVIARNWMTCADAADCGPADMTGDGRVNMADLLQYADNWLAGL